MIPPSRVTGAVLAGGRATRLGGADKSGLSLGPDPEDTTLARILGVFAARFERCVIVTATGSAGDRVRRADITVDYTHDRIQGCGPLGGLDAALRAARSTAVFVCGCDMPSLSGGLIDFMLQRAREDRLLVPVRHGRPEPLHAVYPVSCLPEVDMALKEGIRMMLDFFARVPVDYLREEEYAGVEGADRSFENINTPEDLRGARR